MVRDIPQTIYTDTEKTVDDLKALNSILLAGLDKPHSLEHEQSINHILDEIRGLGIRVVIQPTSYAGSERPFIKLAPLGDCENDLTPTLILPSFKSNDFGPVPSGGYNNSPSESLLGYEQTYQKLCSIFGIYDGENTISPVEKAILSFRKSWHAKPLASAAADLRLHTEFGIAGAPDLSNKVTLHFLGLTLAQYNGNESLKLVITDKKTRDTYLGRDRAQVHKRINGYHDATKAEKAEWRQEIDDAILNDVGSKTFQRLANIDLKGKPYRPWFGSFSRIFNRLVEAGKRDPRQKLTSGHLIKP